MRSSAFARRRLAFTLAVTAFAKAHSVSPYTAVMAAMVTAMEAKVTMPRCWAGSMKSGKKAM